MSVCVCRTAVQSFKSNRVKTEPNRGKLQLCDLRARSAVQLANQSARKPIQLANRTATQRARERPASWPTASPAQPTGWPIAKPVGQLSGPVSKSSWPTRASQCSQPSHPSLLSSLQRRSMQRRASCPLSSAGACKGEPPVLFPAQEHAQEGLSCSLRSSLLGRTHNKPTDGPTSQTTTGTRRTTAGTHRSSPKQYPATFSLLP